MVQTADKARSVFLAAIEGYVPEQWPAYLDGACGEDGPLRDRVEHLLEAHRALGPLAMPEGRDVSATIEVPAAEGLGTTIGPYRLLEVIGEGGMGTVYMAEQARPVRRKVALKVIKPGMDSRQVVARFEAERQALALMDHPNIAKVHDAGTTQLGRPYFVMELVNGIPITDYCDRDRLTVPGRLDLFVLVCRAVQHAHQKGVIHRDLKPSNILVTLIDGAAVPKVIDFGVAKAIGGRPSEGTLFTGFAQMIGTPLYMSPEQAELSGVDTDTRSDVYALGVLLYELLTGTTPIDRGTLCKAAYDEIRRVIREQEPPTPSTRLSSLGLTLSTVSANRRSDPRKLSLAVRGELDWIVMKALEKDRARRYETANDFAADVMNYLTDRPVEACPPSASYRLAKFVRRNRVAISTGAVVASALVLGTAVSTWQAIRAESGERQARANLKKAREAVDQMLVSVAGRLADVPHMESVRRELLADSLKFYEGFLQEQGTDPEVHFETGLAHFQFGEIQTMLGEDRPAEQAYLQAIRIFQDLSDRTPGNAEYRHNLAHGHNKLGNLLRENCGRLAEAEQAYRQALAITRKLDADFPGRYRTWLAGRLNNIGLVLHASGRLTEAESVHREALAIRIALDPYSGVVAESYSNLGIVLKDAHRLAEAEQSHRQAVEIRRKQASLSPNNRDLASRFAAALQNLAVVLAKTGRLAEAESSYRTALAIDEKQAFDFPNIPAPRRELAGTRYNLGNLLRKAGRLAEAEKVYGESLVVSGKLAADFPNTPVYREILAGGHRNLGILLMRSNRLPEAESSFLRAQHIYEALAVEHPGTPDYRYEAGDNIGDVGLVLLDTGRIGEVETLLRRGLASAEKLVSELPDVKMYRKSLSNAHNNLGILHYRRGDWEAAVVSLRKGAELFREHEDDGDAQFALAMALWRIGDKEQARTSYDQAVRWMDKSEPFNERLGRFRAEATQLLKDK